MRRFYEDGLGLPVIAQFTGHSGYSGVVFGLPDEAHQLEFTEHEDGSPCPAPTADNLLVLTYEDREAVGAIVERLAALGYDAVEPENPFWNTVADGVTIPDPDGWRVVLVRPAG